MEDSDVDILLSCRNQVISRQNLKVSLSNNFSRKKLPVNYEDEMNLVWEERCKSNPKLWDGTKFRLDSITQGDNIVFNLGITSYKEFISTNWSPKANNIKELGLKNHDNVQAYMSDALGVGAFVHTADDFTILLRRSVNCGEAIGLWDIPGGHAEPEELVGKKSMKEIDVDLMSPSDVVDEIFNSTLREICDEVNVDAENLTDPILIGVARNTTSAGRPSSEYYVKCNLPSEEIRRRYSKGDHAEADETTNIMFIPVAEVLSLRTKEIWNQIAPSAKGCLLLYCS